MRFDRDLFDTSFDEFWNTPRVGGFHIEMRDFGDGKPKIDIRRIEEPSTRSTRRKSLVEEIPPEEGKIGPIKRMIETDTTKLESPDKVELVMRVPGVNEKEVLIRRAGRTLEIIARKPDGGAYFANFELPPDADPRSRSFEIEEGVLTVRVPRRKNVQNL